MAPITDQEGREDEATSPRGASALDGLPAAVHAGFVVEVTMCVFTVFIDRYSSGADRPAGR
jgi:hypothetical protein